MSTRTEYAPGTFSWVDLSTPEQDSAKEFYRALFGWSFEDFPVSDGVVYSMAFLDGAAVGAISPQPSQQREAGVPPLWNSYISVEDVDTTAARVAGLGGDVHAGPLDVMDAGRMAVVADPAGAFFELWQPRRNIGAGLVNAPGALCWNDLATPDLEGAERFYGELLAWTFEPLSAPEVEYRVIHRADGGSNGGIHPPFAGEPPSWTVYFGCEDLEATKRRVTELGGRALSEPIDAGSGRFAAVSDPHGAVFALYEGRLDP